MIKPMFIKYLASGLTVFLGCLSLHAYDFQHENICYTITSETDRTVEVANSFVGNIPSGDVIIPERVNFNNVDYTVTAIGRFALKSEVTSVVLPKTIKQIASTAFLEAAISSIDLPSSLETLPYDAFEECNLLEAINVDNENPFFSSANGVVYSKDSTIIVKYPNGKKAEVVSLNSTLTSIADGAFYECKGINSITIPNTVTHIGNYAFSRSRVQNVKLPESLVSLGDGCFFMCSKLTSIELPGKLTTLGEGCFDGMEALKSIEVNGANTYFASVNGVLYTKDLSELLKYPVAHDGNNYDIPNSVVIIGYGAFAGSVNLSSVKIPSSVTTIGASAFTGVGFTSVEIPESVIYIGDEAFRSTELKNVTIPKSVKNVGTGLFHWCKSLEKVVFDATVDSIPSETFQSCYDLKTVTISSPINKIGDYAFRYCETLKDFDVPKPVKSIGIEAFARCRNLEKIDISEVNNFGAGAFSGCQSIKSVTLHNSISKISAYLFNGCGFKSIVIPNSVDSICDGAFSGCSNLKSIEIPNNVEYIGELAFSGCSALKTISLGSGIKTIGALAFSETGTDIEDSSVIGLYSYPENPPVLGSSREFSSLIRRDVPLHVPEGCGDEYAQTRVWSNFKTIIDDLPKRGNIALSQNDITLKPDEVFQLGVLGADSEIVWNSSNPSIAYANKFGLIVAMGVEGNVIITAEVEGQKLECNVRVSYTNLSRADSEYPDPVDILVEGVSGNPPVVNLRLLPVDSKTVIEWTTSDDAIAIVDHGIVTMIGEGDSVTFGAKTENGIEDSMEVETTDIATTGIKTVMNEEYINFPTNVYDLTGRCLLINATPEQVNNLKPGIYIYNGKKILVK